jgi:hypothetical protein
MPPTPSADNTSDLSGVTDESLLYLIEAQTHKMLFPRWMYLRELESRGYADVVFRILWALLPDGYQRSYERTKH